MNKIFKKVTALLLTLTMSLAMVQLPVAAEAADVHLPEVEIEDSILQSDVFYLASTSANLYEGANERYLLRVARGGDAAEEAGVNIKISDMTAKYGKDYTVSVFGTGETVQNADESMSLMEMMEGEEYTQSELKSDEEFYDIMEGDEQLQKQTEQAMQEAVDYIEEKSGLADTAPDYTGDDVSDDYAEVLKLYSGEEAYPQKLTSSTDTMQQIQQMANVITDAVIGADLVVNFEAGEKEKYLVIDVKNNKKSDGDRYFYIMLGAPFGSTTNSAASSCALTIVDDEQKENAKFSFSEESYTADSNNLQITVIREGALNQMAVVHLTSEAGSAVAGRDFSPVDAELAFPFGITKQTVDIPIRQEYLKSDADFTLKLEAAENAEIVDGEAYVTIKPKSGDVSLMSVDDDESVSLMAEKSYSITDVVTGDPFDVSSPSKTGQSSHFDGNNKWEGDHWNLEWIDSWHLLYDWNGTVGACWNLNNGYGYDYAGVQADWWRSGSCANIKVGFATNLDWEWSSTTSGDAAYNSQNNFDRQTKNFFSQNNNAKRICFYNQSRCDDCNRLYIYSLKPIYRPFEIYLKNVDSLRFLNEDGSKSEWADATKLKLSGANNQNDSYIVKYTKDGLNVVSMIQPDATYATVTGAKLVDGSWTKSISLSGSDISDTKYFKMDRSWIEDNHSYITFEENRVAEFCNSNTNTYGLKGRMNIKPTFDYKNAKVVVKVPQDSDFGYFSISKENKNVSKDTTYTYHRGDILKLDTVMRDEYKDMYEPAGYKISFKQNESDTAWIKRDVIVPYDDISENRYLNEGKRLKYSYYEITPVFQRKGNAIAVRVKADDVSKLDPGFGFMQAKAVNDVTVDGVPYKEYVVNSNVRNGKIYTVGAKLASSAGDNVYLNWKEAGNGNVYAGDMFYHRASGSKEDNIITLSIETASQTNMYQTLEGNIIRPAYNMRSHDVSVFKNSPVTGGIVSVGSEYAVTDANGHFRTPPIRAMYGTSGTPRYLRYMISVNGTDDLRDVEIRSGKQEKQDIFTTAGSSATTTVNVTRQSVGLQNISTENGSILSEIDVYRDNEHQNEGTSLVVDYSNAEEILELYAKLDIAPQYTKQTLNSKTGEITESTATENITEVSFVQYDPNSNTEKGVFKAKKQDDGSYMAQMSSTDLIAGCEMYIRVTTDRSHGVSNQTVRYDEEGNIVKNYTDNTQYEGSSDGVTYADVFTGYSVVQKGTLDIPVHQTVRLPMNMDFTTLPLVGTTGINFDFPFVTVGAMKTDTGYRMYLGFNPTSLYDTISGNHSTVYMSDSGNYFGDLFSIKNPISSFKNGLVQSYNTAFKGWENLGNGASDAMAAMGAPTWKMSFVFGVYFDFAIVSLTDPTAGTTTSDFEFVGVGGFIAVNAGFKVAWYTLLPVVFIPAYFGIEINGSIMGFFGAAADTSKPKITFDDAKNATVDFNNSLEKFHANVKMTATVQIYVGVGLAGTIGLRGGGTFTAMGDWDSDPVYVENEWGCALIFTAGIWIDLFLFSVPLQYTFPMIKFGSFEEYDQLEKEGVKLKGANGAQASEKAVFGVREAFSDKKSEWLPDDGKVELMSAFSQTSQQTIVENGYEHPEIQLIKLSDGSVFMAFLDNDNSRGEIDRTVLKYAVCKDGEWSDNYTVQNDITGDFQPSICEIEDGKVMIAWISTPEDKRAETDNTNTEDYLNKLEVYTAVIDPLSKTVSDLTQLTDDNRYDYKPICVYDDKTDDKVVYYSKNFDTDATTEEMANSYGSSSLITYMLYSNEKGKWMFDEYYDEEVASEKDRQTLIANWGGQRFIQPRTAELGTSVVPNIADFTAISYNGISVYAYTVDVDSNADTIDDRELFLQFYDFETHKTYVPVRLTKDDPQVADAMPQFARTGSGETADTKLFWYRNSKQIAYIDITDLVRNGIDENGQITDEYLMTKDMDVSARYKKSLDEIYSYVSPISENQHDAVGMADFKTAVDGEDIYVVWTQPLTMEDGIDSNGETKYKQCREVYATALVQSTADTQIADTDAENISDKLGSSWASPYRLTYNEVIADSPVAVIDSHGKLMVAYNTYEQTMNGQGAEDIITFSNQKLMASYQEPCGAVEVTDITLSNTTPLKGDKVSISIDVKNTGLTYADGYTVDVYEYKNGMQGEKIDTITSDNKLLPDNTDNHTIEWTAPDDVDGMSIYAVAHEAEFTNTSAYESEKLEKHAVYEMSDAYVYQDNNGAFKLHATVRNTGNAPSADGDNIDVTFVGPYAMNLNYSIEECNFGSIAIEDLDIYTETENDDELIFTGQTEIEGEISIPSGVFEKFGYVDCFAEPVDADGNALGYGEDVRITVSKPVDVRLNGAELPEKIELVAGESLDLNVTCQPSSISETLSAAFAADDSNVALVSGNKLLANAAGETVLHGIVNPYSMELQDITVKVTGTAPDTDDEDEPTPTPTPHRSSGGSSISSSTVKVYNSGASANGKVSVSKNNPSKGENVTVTVTPDKGYTLSLITVTDKNGNKIKVTRNDDGTYSFVKPSDDVTITPEFKKIDGDKEWRFKDVPETSWYYAPIKEAFDNGRMSGMSEDYFEPETDISRGMFAYAIYNREGLPETDAKNKFSDVRKGSYYETAIAWATDNGIVSGYDDKHYGPDDPITREQMVTMLWRYAKFKDYDVSVGEDTNILDFTDTVDISEWAVSAVQWTVGDGIIKGFEDLTIRPQNNAKRAQMAVILNKIAGLF